MYFVTSVGGMLVLCANGTGAFFAPGAAAYALALTMFLIIGGWHFVQNLDIFLN